MFCEAFVFSLFSLFFQKYYFTFALLNLSMRKLHDSGTYKPYAIINEHTFEHSITELRK